jgi:hypothetical protein
MSAVSYKLGAALSLQPPMVQVDVESSKVAWLMLLLFAHEILIHALSRLSHSYGVFFRPTC